MTAADTASGPGPVPARSRTRRGAPRRSEPGTDGDTLAFVESPVQLLNVLEWAYADALRAARTAPGNALRTAPGTVSARGTAPAADRTGAAASRVPSPRGGVGTPDAAGEPGRRGTGGRGSGSLGTAGAGGPKAASGAAAGAGAAGAGAAGADGRPESAPPAGSFPADPPGGVAARGARADGGGGHGTPHAARMGARSGPGSRAADGRREEGRPGSTPAALFGEAVDLTVVVLAPHDPMTRGQLRRMAELARDEGITVRWEEARGSASALPRTVGSLSGPLRRARRIVVGDPFSRYVQLLLTLARADEFVIVDDGTATMEFVSQLARGERLVRWHRKGVGGARAALFAPVAARAVRRLTPAPDCRVEVFSSMPVQPLDGVTVTANDFAWTRTRFGPPRLRSGTDLVGTSLVETGVVDADRYLEAVCALARTHGASRYFAHRRESRGKLERIATEAGLEIVRPDLPLELIARRGPIGRMILSFPSTVVHTLPLALTGTGVEVAVCDVDPAWLTDGASPRAQGFLSGVTGTARGIQRLSFASPPSAPATAAGCEASSRHPGPAAD